MNNSAFMAPKLRFLNYSGNWEKKEISELLTRVSIPVKVESDSIYRQIGIRSHGKGIFYKDEVKGNSLGNKKVYWVQPDVFILNIVFAWEQAVAKTSSLENGMIASHRFPMYKPNKENAILDFILYFFLTKRGKHLLNIASPGGAGRNKTLGQSNFEELSVILPKTAEQQKIADFLGKVDLKITKLSKKIEYIKKYKKAVMQKLFSQEIKIKNHLGNSYSNWEKIELSDILEQRSERNKNNKYSEVFSVAKKEGVINQVEHLGRSYAANDISNYKVIHPGDLIYTKSPTSEFPFGIIKQNKLDRFGVVSVLYGIYKPSNNYIGNILDNYFSSSINTFNYLNPIVQKGAKNTINISDGTFLKGSKILLPIDLEEQRKISEFLTKIDKKILLEEMKLAEYKKFMKGLLQQMFV